ncbi:MAG TPA: hypothetical protein VF295_08680 [Candidatus Limnocylindria bacterium]
MGTSTGINTGTTLIPPSRRPARQHTSINMRTNPDIDTGTMSIRRSSQASESHTSIMATEARRTGTRPSLFPSSPFPR